MLYVKRDDPGWQKILPSLRNIRQVSQTVIKVVAANDATRVPAQWHASLLLTNDPKIRKMNARYRGFDKPTNVLSFPDGDTDAQGRVYLGDCVLARETVEREALEQHKTVHDHATHLIVHGLLHLLDYIHEQEADAQVMEALEIDILQQSGIANPYHEHGSAIPMTGRQ